MSVTSAKQWRKGKLVTLPSGFTARLRPVTMDNFVRVGTIPTHLLQAAASQFTEAELNSLPPDEQIVYAKQMLDLQDTILRAAFVEPRIVENPQGDNEISVLDVEPEDALWVMNTLFNMPIERLSFFRLLTDDHVATVEDFPSDVPPTEPGDEPAPLDADGVRLVERSA